MTFSAGAQLCSVTGTVEDALTGEPLIGAYVKSGNAVVATDLDGTFSMALPSLVVEYLNMSSFTTFKLNIKHLN